MRKHYSEYSGSDRQRDLGEWAQPAEEQLREVCRNMKNVIISQAATIEMLEREISDLRKTVNRLIFDAIKG